MSFAKPPSGGSLYSAGGQRKYLTPSERSRFIATASACPRAELRTFCLLLAYTGCRISEALAVTGHAVNIAECVVAIRSLKKRKKVMVVREMPIPRKFARLIGRVHRLKNRQDSRLWPWSRSRAWQLVKAIMREAGIPPGIHATPKGLRHGFGLHAIYCGVPLTLVQRWLGHARLETTSIYLQAIGPEERMIASRMW